MHQTNQGHSLVVWSNLWRFQAPSRQSNDLTILFTSFPPRICFQIVFKPACQADKFFHQISFLPKNLWHGNLMYLVFYLFFIPVLFLKWYKIFDFSIEGPYENLNWNSIPSLYYLYQSQQLISHCQFLEPKIIHELLFFWFLPNHFDWFIPNFI